MLEKWLKCIDISSNQASMDWERAVSAGVDAACLRGGYGLNNDPKFEQFADSAPHFLPISMYWYLYPQYSIDGQISRIISALRYLEPDFPFWLDVETTGGKSPSFIAGALIDILDAVTDEGYLSAIYTRASFWNPAVTRWTGWANYDLVVAHYGAANPAIPLDWLTAGKTWQVWQYSADGNNHGRPHGAGTASLDMSFMRRSHLRQNVYAVDKTAASVSFSWIDPAEKTVAEYANN